MQSWLPWVLGAVGGSVMGLVWLGAVSVLLKSRKDKQPILGHEPHTEESEFEPIRSYLEPDEDEPSTPLPSASMAPLSLKRYVEVRGAIAGWTQANEDVDEQLDAVFGLNRDGYQEAHLWWMMALSDADDRLMDVERQVAVFAERYGGSV